MAGDMRAALKVGDRVKDCDPRMPDRVLVIALILNHPVAGPYAIASKCGAGDKTHETRINLKRIHGDPNRRSGWARVTP